MTNAINITDANAINRFSWKRVKMFADFYSPITKYQILAYSIISFLCPIVTIIYALITTNLSYNLWFAAFYGMIIGAPFIFSYHNYHKIGTTLPVSGNEKITFYFIYTFFILQATLVTSIALGIAVMYMFPGTRDLAIQVANINYTPITLETICGHLFLFLILATSLLATFKFKKHKIAKTLALDTVLIVTIFSLCYFFGIFIGGFKFDPTMHIPSYSILITTTIIACSIVVYLVIDSIKHRQF